MHTDNMWEVVALKLETQSSYRKVTDQMSKLKGRKLKQYLYWKLNFIMTPHSRIQVLQDFMPFKKCSLLHAH